MKSYTLRPDIFTLNFNLLHSFRYGDKRVLFAESMMKTNLVNKVQDRVLVLTDQHLYNVLPGKYKLKRRVPVDIISGLSMSTMADNFVVVHVATQHDYLLEVVHKSEFTTSLLEAYAGVTGGQELPLHFMDDIEYKDKKGKSHSVEFREDASVQVGAVSTLDSRLSSC